MPTIEQIPEIVEAIKARLDDAASKIGVRLQVTGSDLDDEWLYVMVTPDQEGIRASDHASLMSRIERDLRSQGYDQLLLVPTLTDM